ncbi:unnamed protein product [Sphagnum jensenii]|uniref:Uncharacterized protein n=1 Tax=Sphagnum jensenii TaxID=128206 RepID=A0ABP1AC17_9BRYO
MLYFFPSLPSVRPSVRPSSPGSSSRAPNTSGIPFSATLSLSSLALFLFLFLSLVLSQLLLPGLEKASVPITIIMSRNVIWLSWFAVKSKEFERDCCGLWGAAAAHGAVLVVLHF